MAAAQTFPRMVSLPFVGLFWVTSPEDMKAIQERFVVPERPSSHPGKHIETHVEDTNHVRQRPATKHRRTVPRV